MVKKLVAGFFMLAFIIGCSSDEDRIGDYRVNFKVDLKFTDKVLTSLYSSKTFLQKDVNSALLESVGFGGVLVVHGDNQYYAFDACCPYEMDRNVIVKVDGLNAVCPKCSTKYEVMLSGTGGPIEGVGKYKLKRYQVSNEGDSHLRVYNPKFY